MEINFNIKINNHIHKFIQISRWVNQFHKVSQLTKNYETHLIQLLLNLTTIKQF